MWRTEPVAFTFVSVVTLRKKLGWCKPSTMERRSRSRRSTRTTRCAAASALLPDPSEFARIAAKTETPALLYTPEILYLLSNISALLPVKWYLGVSLNDTSDLRLEIAEYGQRILGDNLLGLQVGNEPDLYARYV